MWKGIDLPTTGMATKGMPIFVKKITMGVADQLAQIKAEKAAANLKAGQDFLASFFPTQHGDQRLDGRIATDANRQQMEILYPRRPGLRRQAGKRADRPE
jgi:hypothetical protein